jgi:nucleoside-diphosphate-sugar epimerase
VAALRCTDFYGPGVDVSHLGASAFGELAKGRSAQLLVPADIPHDFAYVPDIARAAVALLDADDADFGQAWNMPCAPTRSPRELLAMGAASLGIRLRILAVPFFLLRPIGLFYRFAREVADVGFTWDRPYLVDGGKFARRFGFAPTSFEVGVPATVRAFGGVR